MQLTDEARALIGDGANATLVTLNADGSPQVSVVWVELQGDELVSAHLADYKKLRNMRRDPRVAVTIVGTDRVTAQGDVCNKIGTYLKALAAKDNGVPFYVALPSPTIDFTVSDGVAEIPIEQRAAHRAQPAR